MRPAKRRTASGSSAASSMVSASRASAPTGVFSSWLMLATKSRRTSSTRRLSVWSSASSRMRPSVPSGATRTAKLVRRPPNELPDRSTSPSRVCPSRRTCRTRASSSPTMSWPSLTKPKVRAAWLAISTLSARSSTTAEEESTDRTDATPGGSLVARGLSAAGSRGLSAAGSRSATRPRAVTSGPLPWRGRMLAPDHQHQPSRARSRFDGMRRRSGAPLAASPR